MLQRRLAHSTKLLRYAERIAMGDRNDSTPQAVCLLAPIPPLDWEQFSSHKVCCLAPLPVFSVLLFFLASQAQPRLRMRPTNITRNKVFFQHTSLKHICA
jgi:hypothetical protein